MIKIKRFEAGLFRANPQKAMEKFIQEKNITTDKIVSVVTDNVNVKGISLPSITLTYEE